MILIGAAVLLVLLVGIAVVVGASGVAGGAGRRSGDGLGLGAAVVVPVGMAGVVVVLLLVGMVGLGGARSSRTAPDGVDGPSSSDPAESEAMADTAPVIGDAGAVSGPPARYDGQVTVAPDASPLRPPPFVGDLTAGEVIDVRGTGFLEHAEGVVAQCPRADAPVCRNVAPLLTDGEGRLRVSYRVEAPASGEVLVVEVDADRGAARLAFGTDPAALAVLSVTADEEVAIHGAPPGARVTLLRCDADASTVTECNRAGSATVALDGTAAVPLDAASDSGSRLTLLDESGLAITEPVHVDARTRPRAEVDLAAGQLVIGFGLAAVLLAVAIGLIRTTDWRVPAEAATPFLDAAPLES